MPGTLNRFRIEALHNRFTIDVPVRDNKLVLVGENGTGKSTVASFIYLFLTQQWQRLLEHYNFKSITVTIDSEPIEISKEELSYIKVSDRLERYIRTRLSPVARERFFRLQRSIPITTLLGNPDAVTDLAIQSGVSPNIIKELIAASLEDSPPLSQESIEKATQVLNTFTDKVLYLPTYRRIEQDLAEIFPGWEESPEFKRTAERLRHRGRNSLHVELVEFGMQDVEDTITQKLRELKDNLGVDLNELTSTYLRDVILGVYQSAEPSSINKLDDPTLNTVFSRIDKSVLPAREQHLLRQTIEEIKTRQDFHDQDKVVVHFLTKLIEIHKKQQEKEKDVQEFVNVCNQYLSGKKIVYDNINFSVAIHLNSFVDQSNTLILEKDKVNDVLEMSKLSSGEKQIVSLFSQIYLSGDSNYFVIIDEPELSLSVPWQKRFLPDILSTGKCNGLIAVTHSPYIFDNELDEYTNSLENFMEQVNAER